MDDTEYVNLAKKVGFDSNEIKVLDMYPLYRPQNLVELKKVLGPAKLARCVCVGEFRHPFEIIFRMTKMLQNQSANFMWNET